MFKPRWIIIACAMHLLLLAAAVGCGSRWQNYDEKFLRAGIIAPQSADAPEWVRGEMPKNDDKNVYFVGRGIAYNVLDEKAGYDSARDHVLEQLARHMATVVASASAEANRRTFNPASGYFLGCSESQGDRFIPGEKSCRSLGDAAALTTLALAGDLEDRGVYWEQWYINENPERTFPNALRMKRYKCWVLMSIPKDKLEERIQATLGAHRIVKARPNALFQVTDSHTTKGPPPRLSPYQAARMIRD